MSETTTLQINRAQFNNKQKELLRDVVADLEAQIATEVATLNATISGLPTAPTETLIVQSAAAGPVTSNTTPAFVSGTEFTWDLEASKTYILEGSLFFEALDGTGACINTDSSTATGTINQAIIGLSSGTPEDPSFAVGSIALGSSTLLATSDEGDPAFMINACITTTGAGTLQINWANGVSTGDDTTLVPRSYLKLREVA